VAAPFGHPFAEATGQLLQQGLQLGRWGRGSAGAATAAAVALFFARATQQGVELLRHQLAVGVQLVQERAAVFETQSLGDPGQVVVARGQHVGLLVVQVLDAVLHLAQEHIGAGHGVGRFLGHQPGLGQALQRVQRGAAAQLGELPAAHHLQQLHGELDLADAAARELHVIGALGVPGAAFGRMVADLAVQGTQRIEHAVVQVAAEHEGQHHTAQRLHLGAANAVTWRHHPALEPGKPLPLTALDLQVFLQRRQRHRGRARVAVGAQRQVHTEHKTMLGGVAHQAVDGLDGARKVFVVGDAAPAIGHARRFSVVFVHVDQVDVAGHVQLAGAELAHADDPELHRLALRPAGCTVALVEFAARLGAGAVQGQFGQFGHGAGDVGQRGLGFAIELNEPFHDQLAQHAQGGAGVAAPGTQRIVGLLHGGQHRATRRQQGQVIRVAAVQALVEARVSGQRPLKEGLVAAGVRGRCGHGG